MQSDNMTLQEGLNTAEKAKVQLFSVHDLMYLCHLFIAHDRLLWIVSAKIYKLNSMRRWRRVASR